MKTRFEHLLEEKGLYGKVPNWLIDDILEVAEEAEIWLEGDCAGEDIYDSEIEDFSTDELVEELCERHLGRYETGLIITTFGLRVEELVEHMDEDDILEYFSTEQLIRELGCRKLDGYEEMLIKNEFFDGVEPFPNETIEDQQKLELLQENWNKLTTENLEYLLNKVDWRGKIK